MLTVHSVHVNQWSDCAFPLHRNLVTATKAAWVFISTVICSQLSCLQGCQLPSMPCTNYWLWINLVLWLARCRPLLIFLADHTYTCAHTNTVQKTNRPLCGGFKERTPCLVASSCPETQQTSNKSSDQSLVCSAVCRFIFFNAMYYVQTHTSHLYAFWYSFYSFYLFSFLLPRSFVGKPDLWWYKNWLMNTFRFFTQWGVGVSCDFFLVTSPLNKCQDKSRHTAHPGA